MDVGHAISAIAGQAEKGVVGEEVLKHLFDGRRFIQKEHSLWDYKQDFLDYLKLLKHVVAFYNTYGGYIIFGVTDDGSVGSLTETFDRDRLGRLVREYTTAEHLDPTYQDVHLTIDGDERRLGVLHVPKRPHGEVQTLFSKDGRLGTEWIFKSGTAYFRRNDETVAATRGDDAKFLAGRRQNPFLLSQSLRDVVLENNLPERSQICRHFVGRRRYLEDLWSWLAQPFSTIRLLAGEGGVGKSSLAFHFAAEICRTVPYGFQKVIWLTAKQKRFVAISNCYADLVPDFFDEDTLLKALCEQLPVVSSDLDNSSSLFLIRTLRELMRIFSCFVVIDDLDSMETDDEQRSIYDRVEQIAAGTASKFLISTRKNLSTAMRNCSRIEGLEEAEYREFIVSISDDLGVAHQKKSSVTKLFKASRGSPLFSESIMRLIKCGCSIDDAIEEWKGLSGEDVRGAALKREVSQLSVEAKRSLLAWSYYEQASLTEICQATNYSRAKMANIVGELQSLFLLSLPSQRRDEPRCAVSPIVAMLVRSNERDYANDSTMLRASCKRTAATVSDRAKGRSPQVARAIREAQAHALNNDYAGALEVLRSYAAKHGEHRDVVAYEGHVLLRAIQDGQARGVEGDPRRRLKAAYDQGKRDEVFFQDWFEAELQFEDYQAALEVASLALKAKASTRWNTERAQVLARLAEAHAGQGAFEQALKRARSAFADARVLVRSERATEAELKLAHHLVDRLWYFASQVSKGKDVVGPMRQVLDDLSLALESGDRRAENVERMITAITSIFSAYEGASITSGKFNVMEHAYRLVASAVREYTADIPDHVSVLEQVREKLEAVRFRVAV